MIRFALIDDEKLVADSLATLLSLESDLELAGVYYSGEDFAAAASAPDSGAGAVSPDFQDDAAANVDVVVTDLQLGEGMDGLKVAGLTDAPVVLVTSHSRPAVLTQALAAGIMGVLPKTASSGDFASAIRTVHAGRRWIDPDLAAATIAGERSPLTGRETELVTLAGQGLSIGGIADAAHLAEGTTRNYLSSAMGKLGAGNRYEAYTIARAKGWV